jgi:hypothetical protein
MGCKRSHNMKNKYSSYGDYDSGYYSGEESSSSSSGSYNETDSVTASDYSSSGGGYRGHGSHTDIKDVGKCWFKGIADYGILYDEDETEPDMGTFITFLWWVLGRQEGAGAGLEASHQWFWAVTPELLLCWVDAGRMRLTCTHCHAAALLAGGGGWG